MYCLSSFLQMGRDYWLSHILKDDSLPDWHGGYICLLI